MKQVALEGFLIKHRDVSRTIAIAKTELFAVLTSSFKPLANFTKNPNIGAMSALNAPLEYYNVFWNLYRWSNLVLQNCSLQLFQRYSNSQASELFKLFKWLHLYLIPYKLKYNWLSITRIFGNWNISLGRRNLSVPWTYRPFSGKKNIYNLNTR